MHYKPFEVVVVPFPFNDQLTNKHRPALVVSTRSFNKEHQQTILAMITTAKASSWTSDIEISDWQSASLTVPCKIRMKLFTLDNSTITRKLGELSSYDQLSVKNMMQHCIASGH